MKRSECDCDCHNGTQEYSTQQPCCIHDIEYKYMVYADSSKIDLIKKLFSQNIIRNFDGQKCVLPNNCYTTTSCGIQTPDKDEINFIRDKLIENEIFVFGISTATLEGVGWVFGEMEDLI